MKKVGIFYLIIMMLLSVMPCSDGLEIASPSAQTIQNVSAHHNDGDKETCSPACLCACCGQRVVVPQEYKLEIKLTFRQQKPEVSFGSADPEQRQNAIWNPPKRGSV